MEKLKQELTGLTHTNMDKKDIRIPHLHKMIADAAYIFGISTRLLKSPTRLQDAVDARAMLYQYLHNKGYSVNLIAKVFNKNYDTIVYALKKWDDYTFNNPVLKTRYELFVGKQKIL